MEEPIKRRLIGVQGQKQSQGKRKSRYDNYDMIQHRRRRELKFIAIFRCSKQEKGNKFWEPEDERKCEVLKR